MSALPYAPQDIILHRKPATYFMLLPSSERISFCPACVKDDLKTKKTAIWRERWSFGWYVICEKHQCSLHSLGTECSFKSTKYRAQEACKFLIENVRATSRNCLPDEIDSSSVYFYRPFEELAHQIRDLAFIMQARIQKLIDYRPYLASSELTVIHDLMKIMLRSHLRNVEAPPFCYHLVRKLTGRNLSVPRSSACDASVALSGISQIVDPFPRLLAMALSGYLLGLPGTKTIWVRASKMFAEIGMLVPCDKRLLYAALAGAPEAGIKSWFLERIKMYPIEIRKLCREFCVED